MRLLLPLLLLSACATPYPSACRQFVLDYCDVCELDSLEKGMCTCYQTGTMNPDDLGELGKDMQEDEAQLLCDSLLESVRHPTPDDSATCKQDRVLLAQHRKDACDYVSVY